ncbi:MAG: M28 family peptidase [Candidatus Xenobiia bacterium LiM19]
MPVVSTNGWGRGSQFYVEKARDEGKDIQAAVSIDAIGYNHNRNNIGSISRPDSKNGSPSAKLLSKVAQAFRDYTDLRMKVLTEEDGSDPCLFYKAGYPAVLVSEQFDSEGWPVNPYYHTEDDFFYSSSGVPQKCGGLRYIDPSYAESVLRGVAGWLAAEAGVLDR